MNALLQTRDHESAADTLYAKARKFAEDGQFNEAGSLILQALAHELRSGPQVLQLIKPRA